MHARNVPFGLVAAALVAACGGGGDTGAPADTTPPTLGGVPTDAGSFDDASVSFSWAAVTATDAGSGVAGWRVQVATAPDEAAVVAAAEATASATSHVSTRRASRTAPCSTPASPPSTAPATGARGRPGATA